MQAIHAQGGCMRRGTAILTDHELLGPTAAAIRLGIGPQQLADLATLGRVPYVATTLGKLYTRQAIEQLAHERLVNPPRPGPKPAAK
jgi:hypothetical protein